MMTPPSKERETPRVTSNAMWKRWFWCAVVLLLAAWCGRYCYRRVVLKPDPRTEYWQAQVDRLNPIANDAMSKTELANLLSQTPWEPTTPPAGTTNTHGVSILRFGPWQAPDRPDHDVYIKLLASDAVRDGRRQIMAAADREWPLRYEINNFLSGPWATHQVKFLASHARYLIEEFGAIEHAFENYQAILEISAKYLKNNNATHLLTGQTYQAFIAEDLLYLAAEQDGPWPIDDLASRVFTSHAGFDKPSELLAIIQLEQQYQLDKYFLAADGRMDVALFVTDRLIPGVPTPSRFWNLTAPIFYSRSEMAAQYQAYWKELDACKSLGDVLNCEQRQLLNSQHNWVNQPPPIKPDACAGDLHSSWKSIPTLYLLKRIYAHRTRFEAALTCLALENHRLALGYYPATLDGLVPDFLPRLPIDYVTMQPLRYTRTDERYQLYSVGFDGVDNGATPSTSHYHMLAWSEDNTDIVFSDRQRPGLP